MQIQPLRNTNCCCLLLFFVLLSFCANAQTDTLKVFALEDFLQQVVEFHPVARQAALLPEEAKSEIRIARGLFDPAIGSKFARKEFKSTDYYNYWDNVLQIPTWLGVDLRAGYERNVGSYINQDKIVPADGLTYAGLSVPLAQGLLIDERRATLRQAKLLPLLAEAEQTSELNKLLLQVTKDYWNWAYYYHKLRLNRQSLEFAEFRFSAVRQRALAGDLAAIDTIEALIEVQNRKVMLRQSEVEFENSRLLISNHLWMQNEQPVELSQKAVPLFAANTPAAMPPEKVQTLLTQALSQHPDLKKMELKEQQIRINRKLYQNKLLPKLNLEYNVLQSGPGINNEAFSQTHFSNNYKLGVSFNYPLFLRNERGQLQLATIKLQDIALEQQQARREITNGIFAAHNEMTSLRDQIIQQELLISNARLLRAGEAAKFQNGESTLFLINAREMSLINLEIKYYEMLAKYATSRTVLQWSAGAVGP